MDEHEVEQALRAGLERRADEADVTAPVAARARAEVGRRRRTRWGVLGAAAAVVLVVGGVAVATGRGGDDTQDSPTVSDPSTTGGQPGRTGEWRTEYWAGVAVDVPADWGYGGAPADARGGACYPIAQVGPDGETLLNEGDPSRGWVGRPISLTDVCTVVGSGWEPEAPYVWLGATVPVPDYTFTNGYEQQTIEVAGTTVTVGTDDAALRQEILRSARASDGLLCNRDLPTTEPVFAGVSAAGPAVGLRVCAYRDPDSAAGGPLVDLSYGIELGRSALTAYLAALDGSAPPADQCPGLDYVESEWVVLHLVNASGETVRTDVVHLVCPGVDVGAEGIPGLETVALTKAMVEPWAHNGIPAVVYGPTGGKGAMIDSFIGPLG